MKYENLANVSDLEKRGSNSMRKGVRAYMFVGVGDVGVHGIVGARMESAVTAVVAVAAIWTRV